MAVEPRVQPKSGRVLSLCRAVLDDAEGLLGRDAAPGHARNAG
jgi:hypothetical protein